MEFNLNEFSKSISTVLDVIETDIFGVPCNHSKRIAYMSLKMGKELNFKEEELFDIVSLSLLHDNGASLKILHDQLRGSVNERLHLIESMQEHCIIGDENIRAYPFLTSQKNVIKYHHERYDGSGFFGITGEDIPIMSQIINLVDTLDLNFDLKHLSINLESQNQVKEFIKRYNNTLFSPKLVETFLDVIQTPNFYNDLCDSRIDDAILIHTPPFSIELSYGEIHEITSTFSKIIDAKSKFTQDHSRGLSSKLESLIEYYSIDQDTATKLLIAADLHDLGKLAISNSILDKPEKLTSDEFNEIKKHPEISRHCLCGIKGFEEIAEWIYQHHEKLDGSGYPQGLVAEELSFYSRLLTTLDIYQALREERPYRDSLNHSSAMEILDQMVVELKVDGSIVKAIHTIFSDESSIECQTTLI